eukprot:228597-Chlamydomonas_euryale.AAC.1
MSGRGTEERSWRVEQVCKPACAKGKGERDGSRMLWTQGGLWSVYCGHARMVRMGLSPNGWRM